MRKYTFALIIALLFVSFMGAKVYATGPGGRTPLHGYFTNDTSSNHTPAGTCGGSGWSDVLCGGIQAVTGSVGGPYTVPTKQRFINFIEGKLGSGGSDAVGAAFIIGTMSGLDGPGYGYNKKVSSTQLGDWEKLINQSSVRLGIVRGYSYDWNSAYASDINDDLYYQDSGDSGDSLIFYQNGKPAYALQIICANPVGNLAGLTATDSLPTGSIAVSCNTDGTADLIFTYHDADGTDASGKPDQTAAYSRVAPVSSGYNFGSYYSGDTLSANPNWRRQSYGASPTTQTGVKADGSMEVWLYVEDDGPSAPNQSNGYNYYGTSDSPTIITCMGGTIAASCTPTTTPGQDNLSWSGSFYDRVKATATVSGGGASGTYTTGGATTSATAKRFSGGPISHAPGSVTITLTVTDSGGGRYTKSDTVTCPTNQTGDCPGDSALAAAGYKVTVPLPNLTPSTHTSAPTGSTTTPGDTYYVDTFDYDKVGTISDISSGGNRVAIPIAGGTTVPSSSNKAQSVTLDYSNYRSNYPYDTNQASVNYTTYYKETLYKSYTTTANGHGYYTCSYGGDKLSGSTCTPTVVQGSCPAGESLGPDGCGHSYYSTYNGSGNPRTCPRGGTLQGSWCRVTDGPAPPYYCDGAYNGYSTTCPSYPAQAHYYWITTPVSGPTEKSRSGSTDAAAMNACFSRNFSVNGVSVTASKNSNENPSSGSGSATIAVTFWVSHGGGLRTAYSISNGLSYAATIAGSGGLVCTGSGSGPVTVTTGSTATSYTTTAPVSAVTCSISQPAPLGGTVCATYTIRPTGSEVDKSGNITLSNGGSVSGSACSTPVINEPYLRVFGGDVAAGTGFLNGNNVSCTNSSTASIQTFNTGVNPYGGSGTALAALSVKPIATTVTDEGFASAQGGGVSGSTVAAPKTLSFGNDSAPSKYGGDYGSSSSGCSPDYSSGAPVLTASNGLSGTVDLASLNGTYVATDSLQLSGTVTQGQHVLIYSSWPVTISGPIAFSNPGVNVADMPSFSLIVKNNDINIAGSVNSLAGNYIAQGGTINDCNTGGDIYTSCGTKLTVYGSFVAGNIKFYRMGQNGSLRYSATDSGPGSNNASEEFDYSPATWLAQPPASGTPPAYDAVTSLPPVL